MQTQINLSEHPRLTFTQYISGNGSRRVYYISLFGTLMLILATIIVAYLLYNGDFSMYNKQISQLDDVKANPIGAYVFEVGFILSGLFFIPSALFMMKNMQMVNRPLGFIGGIFYVIAGLGIVVVGCFPVRRIYIMHVIGAGLGFGGLLLAILCSQILTFVKASQSQGKEGSRQKLLVLGFIAYIPFIISAILAVIFAGIPVIESMQAGAAFGEYTPDGWEIYEWAMFITGLFSTLGTQRIF